MKQAISWGALSCCLLAVSLACGKLGESSVDGGGGSGSGGGGSDSGGGAGFGGAAQPEIRDCNDSRSAKEVVADFCMGIDSMDMATYTEREGCDYVTVRLDYEHGDRTYQYDAQGVLVALVADNSFGYSACGVIPSCPGGVVRTCRICRGSWFVDDDVPDCPASLWE